LERSHAFLDAITLECQALCQPLGQRQYSGKLVQQPMSAGNVHLSGSSYATVRFTAGHTGAQQLTPFA